MPSHAAAVEELEQELPPLVDGETVVVSDVKVLERKTRKPTLYTEGTLLADMRGAAKFIEDDPVLRGHLKVVSGLGTAATRDNIIETLKHHRYIEIKSGRVHVTPKGKTFIDWLDNVAPDVTNVAVTARWEAELSLVAVKGGGRSFEDRIADEVRNLIAIFKAAPPMGYAPTHSPRSKSMSENTSAPARTPSLKMLEFAKNIAKKLGLRVPDEVMADHEACKQFIDENKDAAMRPSEKQLIYAQKIADSKGLTIPAETLANGRELSSWIDEHK